MNKKNRGWTNKKKREREHLFVYFVLYLCFLITASTFHKNVVLTHAHAHRGTLTLYLFNQTQVCAGGLAQLTKSKDNKHAIRPTCLLVLNC
jgi:hypothetical protein